MARMISILTGVALLVLATSLPVQGFVVPLTKAEELTFKEKISHEALTELEKRLLSKAHFGKKKLTLDELGNRGSKQAQNLLQKFISAMRLNLQKSGGSDPDSGMLHARALVNLARVNVGGRSTDRYLVELEGLLSGRDKYIQEAVVVELGNIGSKKARDLLAKHENKLNVSPMVKIERLRLDYWHLRNEEFVQGILESAKRGVDKGDKHLVAEGTILVQRGMYEALSPSLLEAEMNSPSSDSEQYIRFIRVVHKRLKVCEDRYHPGSSALMDLYKKRDGRVLDRLREVYTDDSFGWRYREKAYELHLTIVMEQSGLNRTEPAVKYLLSRLRGTGGTQYSDWKGNNKTLEAIQNAAVMKKLVRYGTAALPLINEELDKVSPIEEVRRHEAISYVKEQIIKTAERQTKEDRPVTTFSRPEERGEDFSLLETSEVVRRLVESEDKIELRKAAKELGDRSIAGRLNLSSGEKQVIGKVVTGYLEEAKADSANDRVEARQQIERLWYVAAPTLLENANSRDPTIAETVIKSLILMRNESIVEALVQKAIAAKDEYTKAMAIFALKKMQEQRKSLIPGRKCLSEEESKRLYDRLVAPAVDSLEKKANP